MRCCSATTCGLCTESDNKFVVTIPLLDTVTTAKANADIFCAVSKRTLLPCPAQNKPHALWTSSTMLIIPHKEEERLYILSIKEVFMRRINPSTVNYLNEIAYKIRTLAIRSMVSGCVGHRAALCPKLRYWLRCIFMR